MTPAIWFLTLVLGYSSATSTPYQRQEVGPFTLEVCNLMAADARYQSQNVIQAQCRTKFNLE
jgi:hypothetical protein